MSESISLLPVVQDEGLKDKVFEALRDAVVAIDLYSDREPPRLDERKLAEELGVSRTPVREALSRLEQEGLVRNIPRRGTFVVRKTRSEIIQVIEVWAALESMAARLVTESASDDDLVQFKKECEPYYTDDGDAPIDEYSEQNIKFHQKIIELSGNSYLLETARRSFLHMYAIRAATIKHRDRKLQSVIDHRLIIDALVSRKTEVAEMLVREHALKLAEHVRLNVDFLP